MLVRVKYIKIYRKRSEGGERKLEKKRNNRENIQEREGKQGRGRE